MIKTSLRYLMSVVRHGSIRAASNELNIAQSAISRRLQALEYQIGAPLFERRPRGVVLTEAGELLYAFCRETAFNADRLHSEIDELRGLQRGTLRVASIESLVPHVMCNAVDQFRRQYPKVAFSIDILTTDSVLEVVKEGDVDIGVIFGLPPSSEIKVLHTSPEQLLVAMRRDHPLASKARITIRDTAEWPIALAHAHSGARTIFEGACQKEGIEVKPVLESNSLELLHRFALLGGGITVLLRHSTVDTVQRGELITRQIEGANVSSHLSVIALKERKLTLAAERFLTALRDQFNAP